MEPNADLVEFRTGFETLLLKLLLVILNPTREFTPRDNNAMHAKPDLRVVLKWMVAGSGSVIADVIPLGEHQ